MTVRTADPLPECRMCDLPTARAAWERNRELCTPCAAGVAATVRMLRPGVPLSSDRRRALLEPPQTVFVEAFTPDVPGQLDLDAVFGDVYTDDEQR